LNTQAPNTVNFIFTNLVDTDMLFGHRRNVKGYGKALEEIDEWLGKIIRAMSADDLLIISSDHGNDPTAPGTDHTREFVPLVVYSPGLVPQSVQTANLGIREGFFDVAASLASWFEVDWRGSGKSFLPVAAQTSKP
jgi:phosphopentomutase